MHRVRSAAAAASFLALALAVPVSAKMPFWSVELDPARPVAGEPITVTIRFWEDAGHTQPATWGAHEPTDDLLAFIPADGTARDWVFVPLEPVRLNLMRGTVTLPTDGDWTLKPWPRQAQAEAYPGYPEPMAVTITAPVDPAPIAGGVAFAAIALASIALLLAGRRRRGARSVRSDAPLASA